MRVGGHVSITHTASSSFSDHGNQLTRIPIKNSLTTSFLPQGMRPREGVARSGSPGADSLCDQVISVGGTQGRTICKRMNTINDGAASPRGRTRVHRTACLCTGLTPGDTKVASVMLMANASGPSLTLSALSAPLRLNRPPPFLA